MEEKIVYFEDRGTVNTSEVLSLAKERAQSRGIGKIIIASTQGGTATLAMNVFEGTDIKLVVVPWQFGFADVQPFPQELAHDLEDKGHQVHFGTMLFHTENLYGSKTPEIMANLLRIFGQGMKVIVEIMLMVCDGGCVEPGETVIALAGTASGADTAVVASVAPSTKMPRMRIHEIICKPLLVRKKQEDSV